RDSGAEKFTVFDRSLKNYFDPPTENAWVGLDLGSGGEAVIKGVKYCPRKGAADRMIGGKFQGSSSADFSTGAVDLFTVQSEPQAGVLTTQRISSDTPLRYLRYIAPPDGWCNVAEIEFHGDPLP